MFRTIVIGFDGSSQALDALALGEALSTPETKMVVCCVHPPEGFGLQLSATGDVSLRAEAERRLHGARNRLGGRPHTEFVIRTALSAGGGLHDETERQQADLLIVGSSHRGALGRTVLGSVTRQVLRAAPCAVAVAPASLHLREDPRIEEIGVAFDDGPESRVALESASRLARQCGAGLRLLTVVDVTSATADWVSARVVQDIREEMRELATSRLREELRVLPEGLDATMDVLEGDAASELTRRSDRLDLLIVGSRGYGPLRRALLGSVSERVVEAAGCAVLVLPRGGRPIDHGAVGY